MKVAIPVVEGTLCTHYGQCTRFALFDLDMDRRVVLGRQDVPAPEHQPGLFPSWLAEQGVDVVLAGGMGSKARDLFADRGIEVIIGVSGDEPEVVVRSFLARELAVTTNPCAK